MKRKKKLLQPQEKPPDARRRAAAYIRVSTAGEDQEDSYTLQKQHFEQLLSDEDCISAGIYCDHGITGTSEKRRRGFYLLMRDCENGRIDRIYTKSISRFSRNTLEFIRSMDMLSLLGVTVCFEKEKIDTSTPTDSLIMTALSAAAQMESRSIADNLRWAAERRFRSGEVPNEMIYGYMWDENETVLKSGYRYRNVISVPEEAETVRLIFGLVAAGVKYAEVARRLNISGVTPPLRSGAKRDGSLPAEYWTGRHISNIIMNERYTGSVLTQKTFTPDTLSHTKKINRGEMERILISCHHEAIVDAGLFQRVQTVRARNAVRYGNNKTGKRRVQLLSGLIICPVCGRRCHTNGRSRTPYWFCPDRQNCCGVKYIESRLFELIDRAFDMRFGGELIKGIEAMLNAANNTRINDLEMDMASAGRRCSLIILGRRRIRKYRRDSRAKGLCRILAKRLRSEKSNIRLIRSRLNNAETVENHRMGCRDLQRELTSFLFAKKTESPSSLPRKFIRVLIISVRAGFDGRTVIRWIDNSITVIKT